MDGSTITAADWFNDVDRVIYDILNDPADLAATKDSLFPAWTTPSFSAGDFTANGSMTWTVAAGDVTTYAYIVNGKMMTVNFYLVSTTVAGTPNTTLQIAIPGSKTATKSALTSCAYIDNSGTQSIGICNVAASGTVIRITKADGTTNWTASTDGTSVYGSITFEIN